MKKILPLLLILLVIQGCPIPEKYVVKIDIKKDGTYHASFDGTVVCALFVNGKLCPQKITDLESILKKCPSIKKIKYLENCRYKIYCEIKGNLNKPVYLFDESLQIVSMLPQKNKNKKLVVVNGMELTKIDRNILESAKINVHSTLNINTNGIVLDHNASDTPLLFGMVGDYQWDTDDLSYSKPYMVIELK